MEEITRLRECWTSERRELLASLSLELGHIQKRLDRLIDAFVDGAIDADSYYERKARLIRDRQLLNERLVSAKQSLDIIADRLSKFLELSKTAYQSYLLANPYEKRETVELVTSNRGVDRKNVVIEPQIPFLALAKWRNVPIGDPSRGAPRTFYDFDNTFQNVPNVPDVPGEKDGQSQKISLAQYIIWYFASIEGGP
jgi:hypothetical protein